MFLRCLNKVYVMYALLDLPRYVGRDTYQTILDDKSGYDHPLLTVKSRTIFGIQWGGWYFVYNTLPFGWKISPFVYHSTGLVVSNFFRSMEIPCSLYIDDRHNAQLQILAPNQGAYANLANLDEHNLAAGKSAFFFGSLLSDQAWIFSWFTQIHPNASSDCPIFGFPIRFL